MTQFLEPKALVTQPLQLGSFTQLPSTRNLYSYLPGFNERFTDQAPFRPFFAEWALGSQLLKVPARLTFFAWGALSLNAVAFALLVTLQLDLTILTSFNEQTTYGVPPKAGDVSRRP